MILKSALYPNESRPSLNPGIGEMFETSPPARRRGCEPRLRFAPLRSCGDEFLRFRPWEGPEEFEAASSASDALIAVARSESFLFLRRTRPPPWLLKRK